MKVQRFSEEEISLKGAGVGGGRSTPPRGRCSNTLVFFEHKLDYARILPLVSIGRRNAQMAPTKEIAAYMTNESDIEYLDNT